MIGRPIKIFESIGTLEQELTYYLSLFGYFPGKPRIQYHCNRLRYLKSINGDVFGYLYSLAEGEKPEVEKPVEAETIQPEYLKEKNLRSHFYTVVYKGTVYEFPKIGDIISWYAMKFNLKVSVAKTRYYRAIRGNGTTIDGVIVK